MKGFVLTPKSLVDLMVQKLFRGSPPGPDATLLDPGCGTGAFIDGVIRWCDDVEAPLPVILGVDSDPQHVSVASERFAGLDRVEIRRADFLVPTPDRYDYIVGNPPYVPITGLSEAERNAYRGAFVTARGRFDLYLLFFEQALGLLKNRGRLVFVTPEKFLYVNTARPLRELLAASCIEELHFLDEQTFGGLITYPLVSTVSARAPTPKTRIIHRAGRTSTASLHSTDASWLPPIVGAREDSRDHTLADVCIRISCGVATGADSVFLAQHNELAPALRGFAHPTVAGRDLKLGLSFRSTHSLLVPYSSQGTLLPEDELGPLADYLNEPERRGRLLARTCVARKPWYSFHENPPMLEMLRPKVLCKDIVASPFFVAEATGRILPRHSVYYIVPRDPSVLDGLVEYLNSPPAQEWLRNHCQRAANGFLRLQSHVLKRLPVPEELGVREPIGERVLVTADSA